MTGRIAYFNARLVDPASGLDAAATPAAGLLTEGETILAVGPALFAGGMPSEVTAIDCGGAVLAPGLVDMRVQLRDPGEEHKEDIASASRAAAAGGVTSMVALPNTDPAIDDEAVVEFIARRAREVKLVKVYCYAAITRGCRGEELTEMGLLREAGVLGFTDGVRALAHARTMQRALQYTRILGAPLIQHPEEPSLAASGVMHGGELSTRLGLPGISRATEILMLDRDLTLVEMTGGRYHAAHVSTAPGLDRIRRAKAQGLAVTCDTAPPYFALNELAVSHYRTFAKLSPPLRTEEDRRAVVAALADGTIDAIASDHAPQDQESKRQPFEVAEPGAVGLETLLPVTLELVHNGHLTLRAALALLTVRPAELLGLRAGRLVAEAPADLVIFDPDRPDRIEPDNFRSKSKNSPFDGRLVQGKVLRTVVDGRPVYIADS